MLPQSSSACKRRAQGQSGQLHPTRACVQEALVGCGLLNPKPSNPETLNPKGGGIFNLNVCCVLDFVEGVSLLSTAVGLLPRGFRSWSWFWEGFRSSVGVFLRRFVLIACAMRCFRTAAGFCCRLLQAARPLRGLMFSRLRFRECSEQSVHGLSGRIS